MTQPIEEMEIQLHDGGERLSVSGREAEMLFRHLAAFEKVVVEFESREAQGSLEESWSPAWNELKGFLEAEELEGSEVEEARQSDGTYCCQLRSTSKLVAGQRECKQYVAWYICAWLACVSTAFFSKRDATLVAGPCSNMPGCR
jgi:hypothetical protein